MQTAHDQPSFAKLNRDATCSWSVAKAFAPGSHRLHEVAVFASSLPV
jgi:hypothetical protein